VRLIELELADGSRHKLYLGSSPQASATHIRLDDQPETYLSGELTSYDANAVAAGWIDTLYYTLPQTATVALTLQNENGALDFERKAGEEWTLGSLAEDESFITSWVSLRGGELPSLDFARDRHHAGACNDIPDATTRDRAPRGLRGSLR
jgi:hypothetical protein